VVDLAAAAELGVVLACRCLVAVIAVPGASMVVVVGEAGSCLGAAFEAPRHKYLVSNLRYYMPSSERVWKGARLRVYIGSLSDLFKKQVCKGGDSGY
jgi:hypothetical protein